jgi:hypothetical protein
VPTILWPGREPFEADGAAVDPQLIGWEPKPEGLCRGEQCVPFPLEEGRVDLLQFAERVGAGVAREGEVWAFGEPASRPGLTKAPDFTLPDVDGHSHSLSTYRGRKVLLVTWASW